MLPVPDDGGGTEGKWARSFDSSPARVAAFLVAALFWTIGSLHRSLWEDEFHSMFHARGESVRALFETVRSDNHPPLSFLLQKLSRDLLGESVFALRLPTLLAGLGMLWVFLRLSRRLPDSTARAFAPWLAAFSSYLFWIVTTARMYAWLALATLGLVESVLAVLEGKRSRWWLAPWIALGLYSHYHFFHHLALLGLAALALYAGSPTQRAALRRCALPGLAGLALFVPWGVFAFWQQLQTGDPPTSSYRGIDEWFQAYAHLLFVNARAGGAFLFYGLALTGALAGALLGFLGTMRLVRGMRAHGPTAFSLALLALGVLGPSWTYLASVVHSRSGFHLKYLAGYASPALLIIAAGVAGAFWRRALGGFLLFAMLCLTLVNVATCGSQDVQGAVLFILEHARPGDAVVVRSYWFRDPEHSPTDYGWYARRLAPGREDPLEIPFDRVHDAFAHPRTWLIWTGGYPAWVQDTLREHFQRLETFPCGPEVTVQLYSEPREAER